MPKEFLGDVCRPGDASSRARRRLSVLPLSIAAHAMAAAAFLIAPLGAEIELPPIAQQSIAMRPIMAAAVPAEPARPASRPSAATARSAPVAPSEAPDRIAPEPDEPAGPPIPPGAIPNELGPPGGGLGADTGRFVAPPPPPPPPPKPTIVKPGGRIREPRRIFDASPVYPEIAVKARIEGVVILEAVIDEQGIVQNVRVLHSEPLLDQAAVNAVKQWRYTPTLLNDVPVQVLMTIKVRFSLR